MNFNVKTGENSFAKNKWYTLVHNIFTNPNTNEPDRDNAWPLIKMTPFRGQIRPRVWFKLKPKNSPYAIEITPKHGMIMDFSM
jgi:hypothetical protein